jgi:phospholipid/cholesterol/gamma-HCH transport system permease protein
MALDVVVLVFKPPFAWREFVEQSWFVARVSIVPTLMLSIPLTVLTVFTLNILLVEFGDQVSCALAAAICCWKLPSLSAASLL